MPKAPRIRCGWSRSLSWSSIAQRTSTVDAVGNIYWTQESDDGQDLLFAARPRRDPAAADDAQLEQHPGGDEREGETPAKPGKQIPGSKPGGNIQSLVTGLDGGLYFYFNGGAGATGAQAIGRFDPRRGEIQIVADTQQMADTSNMGLSLDLARGKLLVCGSVIRLFLRHSDAWAILEFEPNVCR